MAIVSPRSARALVTLLLVAVALSLSPAAANAADGYRYWNYFHLVKGAWAFSSVGAGDYHPKDGAVEGWRFGTSTPKQGIHPRADLKSVNFASICADTKPTAGKKRVAVVIDYGTKADAQGASVPAPRAACAAVPQAATGEQVLEAVAKVRAEKGMDCAIDGYPATGCGDPVANATVPTSEPTVAFALPTSAAGKSASGGSGSGGNGMLLPLAGAVVVIGALGAGALTLNRRRQSA